MQCAVVIPTWRRPAKLRQALENILGCHPPPAEVLVHVDAGDLETGPMLTHEFHGRVTWLQSDTTQGPGGGRNRLLNHAMHPLIASFDDDSWPLNSDFFAIASQLFLQNPDAGAITAHILHPNESIRTDANAEVPGLKSENCFQNCGCLLRRDAFLKTSGFLPLRYAYGMEEADIAMQMLDSNWRLLSSPRLQVYHDSKLGHHGSPAVNAAHITNTALLAFLRYPKRHWPLGLIQVLNRVRYAIASGRYQGIGSGLAQIPKTCWLHRRHRRPVKPATLQRSRQLAHSK